MRIALFFLYLASGVLFAQQSPATNPCDEKPISQLQMDRCADYQFKLADARLIRVYEKLLQLMVSHDVPESEYGKKTIQGLKDSEATWESYRDIQCKAAGQLYEGGSMAPMVYSQCLETLTSQRVEALKNIYQEGDWKLE